MTHQHPMRKTEGIVIESVMVGYGDNADADEEAEALLANDRST